MGSTSYLNKSKNGEFRPRSGSSAGSDKDYFGKLRRRPKIRRPVKMNEYGNKRIPDYTEMAYKEAVSKLRYFLTGNYSPTVRSYGGSPSIKNLDDPDELDKKSTILQYRPRPRLTAKYATLYADSLNNYGGNVTAAPPPAPTVDAPGAPGASPDVISFIQKQEEYIEQLERESQYCREELNNLLGKVKEVISENEHLHEAQKNKIISRMFTSYPTGSETDDVDDAADSTGLDTDAKISSKPRKSRPRSKLEGPNIVFESRISELEAQLMQAKIDLKKVQEENNENKRKLAAGLVDSTCLDGFKRQIDNLQRDKNALELQISKLKSSMSQHEDSRYKRNDVIETQLREERANLEAEIRALKDELSKERSRVREFAGEGARRALQERSAAEQRYNVHLDELSHDLAAQYDNVAKLQLELERQRRDESDLKRELAMKNAAIDELKMELKNKSANLQADLSQAQAEKASLEEELASARLAIERHQRQSKHEVNRLNSEIQSLRQRLDRADADLVHSRRENLRLTEQVSSLEKELNMKNLTPISPEKKKDKEKEMTSMLESIENKHAKTVSELETMIHSQNSLMEKLTDECRSLTYKLDDANRRHKEELATLQRQVETLGRSMQSSTPDPYYQAPPSHQSPAHRNVDPPSRPARPDHPPADTARLPEVSNQPTFTEVSKQPTFANLSPDRNHRQSRAPSRQMSRQSVVEEQNLADGSQESRMGDGRPEQTNRQVTNDVNDQYKQQTADIKYNTEQHDQQPVDQHQYATTEPEQIVEQNVTGNTEGNMDVEPQNYEQYQQEYTQDNYDYQQNYATDGSEYQNYDQQQYAEGEYQQNYDQYQQQYEPNAEYQGQYETQDPIYQNVQEYSTEQYPQETSQNYEESTTEVNKDSGAEKEAKKSNESNPNNSPTQKPNRS